MDKRVRKIGITEKFQIVLYKFSKWILTRALNKLTKD